MRYLTTLNNLFPLWAVLISVLAFTVPGLFSSSQQAIVPLLATVMFLMGLTLTPDDFRRVAVMPRPILIGVFLQFLIMPLSAFLLSKVLQLSAELTAGMVLVGSCAGGTASNVICYLGRGDVALSISMTLVSTLLGVIVTPLLCTLYLATTVNVDTSGMILNIIQVVLVPVTLGIIVNRGLGELVRKFEALLPSLSMVAILLIIAIIVALNSGQLLQVGLITVVAVIAHNSLGLSGGYYLARMLGSDRRQSRTIAIEVGMQNSGLGVALALEFFSPAAALPGALFSVWHNISGSLLASRWSREKDGRPQD